MRYGWLEEHWGVILIQIVERVGVVQRGEHATTMAKKPKGTDWVSCWFIFYFFPCCLGRKEASLAEVLGQYSQGSRNFGRRGLFVKRTF